MKFGKFLVIAAVLCMAVGASAQTTVHSGGLYDYVISTPVAAGSGAENLCMVVLSIVNNSGDSTKNPQAYDSLLGGFAGIAGPTTNLHQHHGAAFPPFPPTPTPVDGSSWADSMDTHFLLNGVSHIIAPGGNPVEDYLVNSTEPPAPIGLTDFGSFLSGTFALTGAAPQAWALAQIVVPDQTSVRFAADIASGFGHSEQVDFSFVVEKDFVIPLPAAMPMGLVGLALIRRRR
jgi:hypothetical protein